MQEEDTQDSGEHLPGLRHLQAGRAAGRGTYVLIGSRKVPLVSISRGTEWGFCLSPRADSPPWGSGSNLPACRTQSFQSHDSVALPRLWLDLIILEMISLSSPTWRKLSCLNWEQSASRPRGCSEARTAELLLCWA